MPGLERPGDASGAETRTDFRWLMSSDVCKHCTHAGCLDVCPTGALFRTEFGTVVVQQDICNGCGYCVSGCPYGVIERREGDGRAWKCTLCYDRLHDGLEPACAKACPTDSIQFGPLDELRERAAQRVEELHERGVTEARLYGHDPNDGVGGDGAFFLLLDEPEVYGLPPDPVVPTRDAGAMWKYAGMAASALVGIAVSSFVGRESRDANGIHAQRTDTVGTREQLAVPRAEFRSYYGRQILKTPAWNWMIAAYLFLGGLSGGSAMLAAGADLTGRPGLRRVSRVGALASILASLYFLVADLGRPERFHHMLRVAKPSSPMSMGTWILSAYGPGAAVAAGAELMPGRLRRTRLGRLVGWLARPAGLWAAATAPGVASYTAVLLSQTAVPAWQEAHPYLPFVFTGSAAASGGGLGMLLAPVGRGQARRGGWRWSGAGLEVAASRLMEQRLGLVGGGVHDGKGAPTAEVVGALDGRRGAGRGSGGPKPAGVGGVRGCAAGGECAAAVRRFRGRRGVNARSEICGGSATATPRRGSTRPR